MLLVGIIELKGEFQANQPVLILDSEEQEVARGLSSFSSETLRSLLNRPDQSESEGNSLLLFIVTSLFSACLRTSLQTLEWMNFGEVLLQYKVIHCNLSGPRLYQSLAQWSGR